MPSVELQTPGRRWGRPAQLGPGLMDSWALDPHAAFRGELGKLQRVSRGNGLGTILQRVKLKKTRELPLVTPTDFLSQSQVAYSGLQQWIG